MNLVGRNEELLNYFSGDLTLLSGQLLKISIFLRGDELIIDLDFKLLYAKYEKYFKLRFFEVQEYSFYHNKDYIFYNISNYKFAFNEPFFYISLDPDEETISISKDDQDFVLSKHVEAYSISSPDIE